MPCPHNEITIVQRSQRQSAVAAAAYQSGEKLFCEYDQQVKHYPEKRGIVHNEILLPANAPRSYADRNTLWNAAEAVEKQWNSQLARRWVLTIPREIPPDQYAVLVREFCQQQFVSKGMIADFAIHDPHPPGHNPHAHVLLTMRAMDEHGKWLPKSRKVYDLDESGERIKLPSGRWKSHKEDTVDWNDQKYCEIWRHEWEVIQNRYLEANDRPERVDLRSYARQGLDIVPTVHEGAAVRQMEKRGIQTNIGNLNREIRAANRLMKSIRQLIQNLKGWITELGEKRKELLAQKAAEEATLLPNLLMKYMEIRKEERKDWTRAGQNRGTSQDLKAVSEALSYLRQKGLSTVEDLEAFLESSGKSAADYRNQMKPKEARSKVIDGILASRTDCKECKPVYEKYQKIFFKKTKEKFKQEHPEVARYEKAAAYLAKHPDDKDSTQNKGLEVVIREELDNDQWKRYEIFQDTLGGRPYLFNGGLPPGGSDGSGTPGIDYQVPAEALTDSEFAAIYKEAQKYVGTPYVWGGSTPETGFDCSGYVCWVYNQNGYDVGRTTANGLWNKSQHISEAEAKPGDLVFFKGTYDTPGMSHTGIYLGNGMMVSAGDPIKYANIHSSYWEKHLAGFGRLSK